jgi:hypothetical protein
MFEILGQFLEQECSPGHIEWYGEYGHKVTVNGVEKYVRDEMQDLWDWWCKDYIVGIPAREDAIHAEIEKYDGESNGPWYCREYANLETAARVKELYRELTTLETSMHEELQARLHRLVDVRGCMWT